jgi:uncharacterized membrane-anchored protein
MKPFLVLIALVFAFNFPLFAQSESESDEEGLDSAAFEADFTYLKGVQKLPCNATLNVPKGHKFLDKDQAVYVLRDIYGNTNIDSLDLLGMIIPENEGILKNSYIVVLKVNKKGYVSDEDVADMDFDALEEQLKKIDTNSTMVFGRWMNTPFYDKDLKVLHLPKIYFGKTSEDPSWVNINNWILGREGYIETITVCDTVFAKNLGDVDAWSKTLVTYDKGFTYADFDEDKDLKSAMTLGAIAFGGLALAKKGIIAVVIGLIAKFGKIIAVVFFGGIAAFFRKLFNKKDKKEESNTPESAEPTKPSEPSEPTTSVE